MERRIPRPSETGRPRYRAVVLAVVLSVVPAILAAAAASAQSAGDLEAAFLESGDDAPWEILADEVNYDRTSDTYIAKGHVEISQLDKRLSADFVRFNHVTYDAMARGHVVLQVGADLLIGEAIDVNLRTQTGKVTDGTVFLAENHFYIQGDRIQKLGRDAYRIEGATVTSCDGDRPDWKITARKVDVTVEGYGVARHSAFWARSVPVAYSPLLVFPAKRERQTGLLFPEFGFSDRKGTFYIQPFFWAIDESSDATFYAEYMDERGLKVGGEYRYLIDEESRGTMMLDYLDDRRVDDGKGDDSEKWGYTGDNFLRTNSDRYWFRMKHDQGLPADFTARLDLDIVSDQDYLTEFRRGLTGFEDTREYFEGAFSRDIDDYTDTVRTNSLVASRYWDRFSLNSGAIWNDDVVARTDQPIVGQPDATLEDTSLHKMPFVEFDAIKQPIGQTRLYWDMSNEYAYLYSEDNSRGQRIDLYPRVYWPTKFWQFLSVEPSAGVRQTAWWINDYQDNVSGEADKDDTAYRLIYDLRLDTSTEVYRIFDVGGESIEAVRHSIRPRVVYEYIPDEDQDDLPGFFNINERGRARALDDGINRIDRRHLITYSLLQNLTAKIPRGSAGDPEAEDGPAPEAAQDYRYRTLGRLEVRQSYDVFEANEDDPDERRDPDRKRPFSAVRTDLDINPTPNLSFDGRVDWDPYENRFVQRDAAVTWKSERGDRIRGEYRYDEEVDEVIESAYGSITLKLPYSFTAYASHEQDLEADERIETVFGLVYQSQCWAVNVRYTEEEENREVAFMVRLFGLGELGNL